MTIQELYDYAKKKNMQNADIFIGSDWSDDWDGVDAQKLTPIMLSLNKRGKICGKELSIPNIFITI